MEYIIGFLLALILINLIKEWWERRREAAAEHDADRFRGARNRYKSLALLDNLKPIAKTDTVVTAEEKWDKKHLHHSLGW